MKPRWTAAEYQEYLRTGKEPAGTEPEKKRRKYGNQPVTVDGMRFDSQHEAQVYQELMLQVAAGELRCVCRQVDFDLIPGQLAYRADFVVIRPDLTVELIDAKSEATKKDKAYIIKKKLMKEKWGFDIREI